MKREIALCLTVAALTLGGCGGPVADAKSAVADKLKDPSSAQFRNITENNGAVCGEVNGKNSWGAYSGFTRFVYRNGTATMEPDSSDEYAEARAYFGVIWTAACGLGN